MTVTLATTQEQRDRWSESAASLRALADRMENGEIVNVVVIADDRDRKVYMSFSHFDDRWRMLGSIEYAKGRFMANPDDPILTE